MEFDAEFYVLLGFIVFLCLLGYLGVHRLVLSALDARGKAIADELAQAAKLRAEAMSNVAAIARDAAAAIVERLIGRAAPAKAIADAVDSVKGPADEFCLVVTQRRHLDDTELSTGELGRHWLVRAQAFAGGPTEGPAPNRR